MADAELPDLAKIVAQLNGLQERGVIGAHAIGGAFAFIFYSEPFETHDLDVLGYSPRVMRSLIEGFPVQILPCNSRLAEEALEQAQTVRVGDEKTRVFTAEHAVAIALQTNRPKDRLKIEHLLETSRAPLDRERLMDILCRHGREGAWTRFQELRNG